MSEVDRLAHEIALEAAASAVDCHSMIITEGRKRWLDTGVAPRSIDLDLRYLALRGAIERHPLKKNWVRLVRAKRLK